MGIADLGVVQSTRGYDPKSVSHYTATWVPKNEFQTFNEPTWPLKADDGTIWDKVMLRAQCIDTWKPLMAKGVPIHVGEWGCLNKTPHNVAHDVVGVDDFLFLDAQVFQLELKLLDALAGGALFGLVLRIRLGSKHLKLKLGLGDLALDLIGLGLLLHRESARVRSGSLLLKQAFRVNTDDTHDSLIDSHRVIDAGV